MKRVVLGLGLLGISVASASGCDDTRPVVGLPPDGQAGEMSQGEAVAGAAAGGSAPVATSPGSGGVPGAGGQNDGGQPAEVGDAGGAAAEQP
jgi:hypothetical protein